MFLTASLARLVRTGDSSASCAANAQHVGAVSLKAGPHEAVQPGRSDPVLGLTHRASGEFRGEAQVDAGAHRGTQTLPGERTPGSRSMSFLRPCELVHGAHLTGRANPGARVRIAETS